MSKQKVLLAFSGGLDTSYCVKYLHHELGLEVHTAIVNTGGFSEEELEEIGQKAQTLGSASHKSLDEQDNFYQQVLRFLIYGNVLKNGNYPLSVSAERICQAQALAHYAEEIGADYIAHGSTGAGNDQIRFDLAFHLLIPQIKILAPIRELKLSRQAEIDYLIAHGVEGDWTKSQYSINKGIWGTSVGGVETLGSRLPIPDSAYPSQLTATEAQHIELMFEKGELVGLNGEQMASLKAIQELEKIASSYAIGRDIHTGDTIIGIKGRVAFEAAAATLIIKAHHTLEKHTLTKWQMHWKEQLAHWYGMFIHEAQYHAPIMRNIETFLESTQETVTGSVFVELHPYRFVIQGIESPHDLMNTKFGDYGEMNKQWDGSDVEGFTKILAVSSQIFRQQNAPQP